MTAQRELGQGKAFWKNVASLASSDFVSRLLLFAAGAYLTRTLTQAAFGRWSLAIAVASLTLSLASFGSEWVGVREIARRPASATRTFRELILLKLAYCALAVLVLFGASMVLPVAAQTRHLIQALCLLILAQYFLVNWVFQGIERMAVIGVARVANGIVYLVLVLSLVGGDFHVVRLPWLLGGTALAVTIAMWVRLPRPILLGRGRPTLKGVGFLARQSIPLGLSFILVSTMYYVGPVVLGVFHTEVQVGLYGAAFRAVWVVVGLSAAYHEALFPVISRLVQDRPAAERLQSLSASLVFALAIPLGVGGTIVSGPLMALLFGHEYGRGGPAFAVLVWCASLILVNNVYARPLLADRRIMGYLRIVCAQAACFLAVCFVLVPRAGAVGAATAAVAGEIVGLVLYPIAARKVVRTPLLRFVAVPVIASLAMAALLVVTQPLHVLAQVALGGAAYVAVFFFLRGMSLHEIRELLMQVRPDGSTIR